MCGARRVLCVVKEVCVMAASPSLSPSSQNKARRQGWIENCERVSAECSSGVVRVVHCIPGVWSLCAGDC